MRHIQIALDLKYKTSNKKNKIDRLKMNSRRDNYLYLVYMFVKFIYILNLIGQIILMDVFFEFRNYSFGFDFLKKFLRGDDYSRIGFYYKKIIFHLFFTYIYLIYYLRQGFSKVLFHLI